MARRLIEDDLNKKKRKPTASISTIQNVARQVKSAPVKRQTMNLQTNRATAKPSVQKQARPRPMERKTFEAPPAQKTEPASNYFTRVDTGRTPEQQKRHDIMVNAVREYEGNPSALYDPAAPQKAVKFAGQSTENIYSGLTRNIGNAAFGGGDIRLMGRQDYNANRENDRTREAGLPTEWLTEVNVDPNEFRDNALYQTMMSQAKEHENEMTPTTWGNLMQNFGYNLPGGAAAVALAPLGEIGQRAGNLGLMGLASYGAGLEEKLNEGYDEKYARRYGLAHALNETLFQESIDPFHGQLGVTPYTLKNVLGESVQEGAGEAVSPYMDLVLRDYDSLGDFGRAAWDITKDQVLNRDYLRNVFKAAEMGALGAGINSMFTNPVGTYRQAVEDATTLADNVQSAIDQRNASRLFNEIMNTPGGQLAQARAEAVQEAQEQAEMPQVEPIVEQAEQPGATPAQGQMQLDLDGMPAGTDLSGGPQIINEEEGETVDLRNDPLREMARDEAARARMNRLLDEESVINEDEGETVDLRNDPLRSMLRDQTDRELMDRFIDRGPTVIDEDASESETIINPGSELRERMEKAVNAGDMTDAEEAIREGAKAVYDESLSDDDPVAAKLKEEELKEIVEETIPKSKRTTRANKTAERFAKGEGAGQFTGTPWEDQNRFKTGIEDEEAYTQTATHTDEEIFNTSKEKFEKMGFDKMAEDLMKHKLAEDDAPTGRWWERLRKGKTGVDAAELWTHMSDAQFLANESQNQIDAIEKELQEKGWSAFSPDDGMTYKVLDGQGALLNTDEAKAYTDRLNKYAKVKNACYDEMINAGNLFGGGLQMMNFAMLPANMQLDRIQKTIDKLNNELMSRYKLRPTLRVGGHTLETNPFKSGKLEAIKMTQEFKDQYKNAPGMEERMELVKSFLEETARKYPHTGIEKLSSFRYLNMLHNIPTWMRNFGTNQGMVYMTNHKNLNGYLVEKAAHALGLVSDYSIDLANADDQSLYADVDARVSSMIPNAIADNNGKSWTEKYEALKKLGFSGAILQDLASYKGDTYDMDVNGEKLAHVSAQMASNLKNAGQTLDGKTDADIYKLISEAYNQNERQFIDSNDLRHTTADGKFARSDRSVFRLTDQLWNDQWSEEAKSSAKTRNSVSRKGMEAIFWNAFNEKSFSESGIMKWPGKYLNTKERINNYMMNDAEIKLPGGFSISIGDQSFARKRFGKTFAEVANARGYTLGEDAEGKIRLARDGKLLGKVESRQASMEIGKIAAEEAARSTFRQYNQLAEELNRLAKVPGANLLFASKLPFVRTPVNIGYTALAYSPAGLAKAVTYDLYRVKSGTLSPETWIDNMAKGMTGTQMAVLGIFLAHMGYLTAGREDEDKKEQKFKGKLGEQNWAVNIPKSMGGGSYTISWGMPVVAGVLAGAEMYEIAKTIPHRQNETKLQRAADVTWGELRNTLQILRPVIENSYFQNLKETATLLGQMGEGTATKTLGEDIMESYIGQFTPVMGSKIRSVWDDTARSTYSTNIWDRMLRTARSRSLMIDLGTQAIEQMVTGEHRGLEPQLDTHGNEIKRVGGNPLGRGLYALTSPGIYAEDKTDEYDDELVRLYKTDKSAGEHILPGIQYKFNSENTDFPLKPAEVTELNKYYLQNYKGAVEDYMDSAMYSNQTDKERMETVRDLQNYYYKKTQEQYFSKVKPSITDELLTANQKLISTLETKMGISPYQTINLKNVTGEKNAAGESIADSQAMRRREYLESIGLTMPELNMLVGRGLLDYSNVGVTEKVAKWDTEDFRTNIGLLNDGLYGNNKAYTYLMGNAGMTLDQVTGLKGLESDKDQNGETIRNSRAYKAKDYLISIGAYDEVVKLINEGKLEPGDVYLNKTVMGSAYKYRGNSGSGSSSKKSSGGGSSRKRSSTTDMDKVYQKLYKMAMSGTLDSIGDLASQIGRQAQADYGPKSQTTNHEALINELEKMVSQQQNKPR